MTGEHLCHSEGKFALFSAHPLVQIRKHGLHDTDIQRVILQASYPQVFLEDPSASTLMWSMVSGIVLSPPLNLMAFIMVYVFARMSHTLQGVSAKTITDVGHGT